MSLRFLSLSGAQIDPVIIGLAALRIRVFRDWPYLYDGDRDYERTYLRVYRDNPRAVVVAAFDGETLVGAATGLPMADADAEFAQAFAHSPHDVSQIFYCAESVLLPDYRGQGAGHRFFELREAHARAHGFGLVAFCSVVRPDDHPARPAAYTPLDGFWRKRGYAPLQGIAAQFSWRDVEQDEDSSKNATILDETPMKIAAAAYPLDFLPDWAAYEHKLTDWVAKAVSDGADLLVFPEYGAMELASLGGAAVAGDLEAALIEVMSHHAAVTALHCRLAAAHGVHILGASGPAMAGGARPVNRAVLYGPDGVIGHQDKQIMTRFEREEWDIAPGQGLKVFDTALGKIGVIICYDSEFPLLARALVDSGAEFLLAPSCTETLAGYTRVKVGSMARALENQCVCVHAPTVGPAPWCPAVDMNVGAAAIYGPPDLGFPETGIVSQTAMNTPGWTCAEIDPDTIARVRREGAVLNHAHWNEQKNRILGPIEVVKPPYSA